MKYLFIDRDGTILCEPADEQIDSFEKFKFVPGVISALKFIVEHTDYHLVMVSNQDGLGTVSYPEETFWPTHNLMLQTLEGEGIRFDEILIDRSFPDDNLPTRKPGTALLTKYLEGDCDMSASYVIGDRPSDAELAKNLGCKALILLNEQTMLNEQTLYEQTLSARTSMCVATWAQIAEIVFAGIREAHVHRATKETDIDVRVCIDGSGHADIHTGLGFFDHMLEQIAKHSGFDLSIQVQGDLNVDEHHTIEDTALALGQAIREALGDKRGIERYGFCLPMDECLCSVALDFGGRPWLVWEADFKREKIGDMPTEMFMHFFKSFSDAAAINLNIKAEGTNEHHKIEGIFKALARSLKMAVKRDIHHFELPTSKGVL